MLNINNDSRLIKKGDIFVAIKGVAGDGHDYIDAAIKNGASKLIVEKEGDYKIPYEIVDNSEEYLLNYLKQTYKKQIDKLKIIGITGTNGKTTSALILHDILNKLNKKATYIGTLGFYCKEKIRYLENTTPDICLLYSLLLESIELGAEYVVMEVSSHGLCMGRVTSISFDIAAFTNLTHEHLDYHKTMEQYALAKQMLFKQIKKGGVAIINSDDEYKDHFLLKENKNITYGFNKSDFQATDLRMNTYSNFNCIFEDGHENISTNLIAKYNIYNLLLVISILRQMDISWDDIKKNVEQITSPPGRLEKITYLNNVIIVDYAHTPDAVKKLLEATKSFVAGSTYVIFGGRGGRDKTKRPITFEIASSNSTKCIITNDDPHNEDPTEIVNDIIRGTKNTNYEICLDRASAIKRGIELLNNEDCLLILGKGPEEYTYIGNKKIPYNDKETVLNIINNLK